jgi:hypothetical protein
MQQLPATLHSALWTIFICYGKAGVPGQFRDDPVKN